MLLLAVEPLDLGPNLRALGLALTDAESEEPPSGPDAARVWSCALITLAGGQPFTLDFVSQSDRIREFCQVRGLCSEDTGAAAVTVKASEPGKLAGLLECAGGEVFGVRAGGPCESGDADLERDIDRRGLDAYHQAHTRYLFCAICEMQEGSVTLLSDKLWASEVARRLGPALRGFSVRVDILM